MQELWVYPPVSSILELAEDIMGRLGNYKSAMQG